MKRFPWRMLVETVNTPGKPLGPDLDAREVWALRTRREIKSRGLLGLDRKTGVVTWHPWPQKTFPAHPAGH
jgi:hypothetical protein